MAVTQSAWETYVDELEERRLVPAPADDAMSRIVAFTSPYLFWLTVAAISMGILALR